MTNAERLDRLEAENRELRDDLNVLRASLATEVRTRRLVVEEEDGFERIVAEGHGTRGTVEVLARPVDRERASEGAVEGEAASVTLLGCDESIPPKASVYFLAGGDVRGSLDVWGTWLAPDAVEAPHCSLTFDRAGELPSDERVARLEKDNAQLRRVLRLVGTMFADGSILRAVEPQEVPA